MSPLGRPPHSKVLTWTGRVSMPTRLARVASSSTVGTRVASGLVVRIDNRESPRPQEGVDYRVGMPEHFHVEDGVRDVFVLYQHEQPLGYGVMYQDAPSTF